MSWSEWSGVSFCSLSNITTAFTLSFPLVDSDDKVRHGLHDVPRRLQHVAGRGKHEPFLPLLQPGIPLDLVLACGESGAVVNIKKGQFLGAGDMEHIIKKVESTGCKKIMLTERGNSFGYGNLVADMRNIAWLKEFGYPVVFDATHSVQRPGAGAGGFTPGDGPLAPVLARAAVAAGCDGVFMETHPRPAEALSDAQNSIPLAKVGPIWTQLRAIHEIVA